MQIDSDSVPSASNSIKPCGMIVAVLVEESGKMGIGKDGHIPWHLPSDLKYFQQLTTKTKQSGKRNAVVMGRKTWESLHAPRFKPLPGRLNIVVSRQSTYKLVEEGKSDDKGNKENKDSDSAVLVGSLEAALSKADQDETVEAIWIIGGGELYRAGLDEERCTNAHVTEIAQTAGDAIECDTYFPALPAAFTVSGRGETIKYEDKKNKIELTYRNVVYSRA